MKVREVFNSGRILSIHIKISKQRNVLSQFTFCLDNSSVVMSKASHYINIGYFRDYFGNYDDDDVILPESGMTSGAGVMMGMLVVVGISVAGMGVVLSAIPVVASTLAHVLTE